MFSQKKKFWCIIFFLAITTTKSYPKGSLANKSIFENACKLLCFQYKKSCSYFPSFWYLAWNHKDITRLLISSFLILHRELDCFVGAFYCVYVCGKIQNSVELVKPMRIQLKKKFSFPKRLTHTKALHTFEEQC